MIVHYLYHWARAIFECTVVFRLPYSVLVIDTTYGYVFIMQKFDVDYNTFSGKIRYELDRERADKIIDLFMKHLKCITQMLYTIIDQFRAFFETPKELALV